MAHAVTYGREMVTADAATSARTFLGRRRNEILAEWQQRAKLLPAARGLSTVVLLDHVPQVLDELAARIDDPRTDLPMAARHAVDRLEEGFDVGAVIDELSLLRDCIFTVWERDGAEQLATLRAIDGAIDHTIRVTVARFADSAQRARMEIEQHLRQLNEQRERALAKLESLLAASPVGIAFVDRDLRYLRINDALAALNGKPAAEHIGRTVREVLPGHADQLEQLLRHVLETGEPELNIEVAVPGPTPNDTRWILATYFPVRTGDSVTGVGGVVMDVTEEKRTEQALRIEQARLRSIVEHAPAAIWVKDSAGRVVLANERLADALGHTQEEVIGHRSDQMLPTEFATQHQEHDRIVLAENRAIEVEEVVPSPTGMRTFLSIKFPIPGDPPLVGGIATEITDRKRMEEDLRIAVRTREDMMAVVGHDLRSPLGAVQLSATLLLSQLGGDQRARRHLDMIHRACMRIENLIDDLLDTASIRAGRFVVETRSESLDEVVSEALELQRPLAEEQSITIVGTCHLPEIRVRCDRDRILQVFGNLIGNALKFSSAGGTITVDCARDGDMVRISVTDTGPGIKPEVLQHLFDPYWSGPDHAKYGAGLGLYIVRGIIERHGGRVWVESELGHGATFFFTLPIEPA